MSKRNLSRRDFLKSQLAGAAGLALGGWAGASCGTTGAVRTDRRVIALGLDGMDPHIMMRLMQRGKLPTFAKLAGGGTFGALHTSNPPQSPVAWANFIAGAHPGRHGIFDFVHRDPETYLPYLSTSRTVPPSSTLTLGDMVIPLSSGKAENLRRGTPFWDRLAEHGVPATVFKIPSNFPPSETGQRTFSGMGTPDILGTYGIFSYYTDQPAKLDTTLGGGAVYTVKVNDNAVHAALVGPENSMMKSHPETKVDFSVYRDPSHRAAKLSVQGAEMLLKVGEWSPWVRVTFDMFAGVSVSGICRFYLKEVHPHFKLYVTPINIDPSDPFLPISTPEEYAAELAAKIGPFHTKGLPADTKALDQGILTDREFLALDDIFLEEKLAIFEHELSRFDSGLLFYYVSSTDQRGHMFWRNLDPKHPAFDAKDAAQNGDVIEKIYTRMDELLSHTLSKIDKDTMLVAFSDHGFAPFYRSFHLNSWLRQNGYLTLKDGAKGDEKSLFGDVDWSRTQAYAIGFNGLYINEKGREQRGSVPGDKKEALVREIAQKLEQVTDSEGSKATVSQAVIVQDRYPGAPRNVSPDIIVGYNSGYRASWQTALGSIPEGELYEWNKNKWSGDHCVDANKVPGMLAANRPMRQSSKASLYDLTATLLDVFDVPLSSEMDGTSLLKKKKNG